MSEDSKDIEKLAELRDKGILTPDEFERKKGEILSRQPAEASSPKAESGKPVTLAWNGGAMVGYVFLSLFIPIAGFIMGIIAMAKGGRRTGQGVALFLISIFSFIIYGAAISSGSSSSSTASTPQAAASATAKPVAATPQKADLQLLSYQWTKEEYAKYVTGSIRNNSGHAYGYVQVSVNLYDSDKALVGSTMANVNDLEPGGVWKFKAIVMEDNVASYKIGEISGF